MNSLFEELEKAKAVQRAMPKLAARLPTSYGAIGMQEKIEQVRRALAGGIPDPLWRQIYNQYPASPS